MQASDKQSRPKFKNINNKLGKVQREAIEKISFIF